MLLLCAATMQLNIRRAFAQSKETRFAVATMLWRRASEVAGFGSCPSVVVDVGTFVGARSHSVRSRQGAFAKMADDEREENAEVIEEEEEWTEPVDLAGLVDGPTTTFVGGFSAIKAVAAGLARVTQPGDAVVVLPGSYEGDVALDTTKLRGVEVRGDAGSARGDVVIRGRLVLEFSSPTAAAPKEAAAEGEDDDAARKAEPAKLLRVSHLAFLGGGMYNAQTAADVSDCVFGSADRSTVVDHCLATHGFSTVTTSDSVVFGTAKSAIYCFPRSRVVFERCDFVGATTPQPLADGERKVRKRGAAPPPPAPPTTPSKCECDVGIYLDDGSARFVSCAVKKFDVGVLTNDTCPKSSLERISVSLISTVGVLCETNAATTIRGCVVKMCGRECLVLGDAAHPTVRDNIFVGDVRLKRGCVATGVTDNTVALSGKVLVEDETFHVKGLTVVAHDPTLPKVKKMPKPE